MARSPGSRLTAMDFQPLIPSPSSGADRVTRVQKLKAFMSFRSIAAKNVVLRTVAVMTVAGAGLVTPGLTTESLLRA